MEAQTYAGPIAVTTGNFVLWCYLLLFRQRGTKYRNTELKCVLI